MHGLLVMLALAAVGVALGPVAVRAHDPVTPGAVATAALPLTHRLVMLGQQLRRSAPPGRAGVLQELTKAARARRQRLETLIDEHPAEVLGAALSRESRALLPPEVQGDLETDETAEGLVEVYHADTVGGGRYLHTLLTPHGPLALRLAGRLPDLLTGDRIRVRGVRLGPTLAAGTDGGVVLLAAAAPAGSVGDQPTLVIVVNFSDTPGAYGTAAADQVRNVVFGSGSSVANYFGETSYGRTWLSGQVVGPYAISMARTVCDTDGLALRARQAASGAGVNLGLYRRQVFVFPSNACPWAGLGTVGGNPSAAWINGSIDVGIIAHEIGHGFGLYHSHALECGSATIGVACSAIEYGDTLDVMGASLWPYHLNAPQKERLGWLSVTGAPPVLAVQQSGVYTLTPYEVPGSGPKALRVRRANGDWYYVEYRQGIGFDTSIPASVRSGLIVHLWSALDPDGIFLLDMTPATASWMDPALAVGQTFTDAASGLSISPVSVTAADAAVNVSLATTPCTTANPTIAVASPSGQGSPGASLSYSASITNHDSAGCPAAAFTLGATAPPGWLAAFASGTLTIAPGTTVVSALTVTSPPAAPAGPVEILVSAAAAAPARAAQTTVTYTVASTAAGTVIDEFNRADASTLDNGWSMVAGALRVEQGEARSGASAMVHAATLPALTGATQDAHASFARVGTVGALRFGLMLRYQGPGNYYACYRQTGPSSRLRIVRVVNGAEVILAQASVKNPAVNGLFELGCRADGATLTLSLTGGATLSATDATFAAGSIGMLMGYPAAVSSPKSQRADHFRAGVD